MQEKNKPYLGAAMPINLLDEHREWLIEGQRDLEIQDAFLPSFLDSDWASAAKEASRMLDSHTGRRGIHGPFIGYSLSCGFDSEICKAVSKRLSQALDFGEAVGASHMVIHSPFINFGSSPFAINTKAESKKLFNEEQMVHNLLDGLVEKAEKQKCCLVIENIQDTNPRPLLELIASFNSPWVRMSLDIGHAFITQNLGGPSPDQWVREAGTLLEHLHIQDTDGLTDRHWTPGSGNINWFALFEALGALEHSPRLHLELRNKDDIRKGAAYLENGGYTR